MVAPAPLCGTKHTTFSMDWVKLELTPVTLADIWSGCKLFLRSMEHTAQLVFETRPKPLKTNKHNTGNTDCFSQTHRVRTSSMFCWASEHKHTFDHFFRGREGKSDFLIHYFFLSQKFLCQYTEGPQSVCCVAQDWGHSPLRQQIPVNSWPDFHLIISQVPLILERTHVIVSSQVFQPPQYVLECSSPGCLHSA